MHAYRYILTYTRLKSLRKSGGLILIIKIQISLFSVNTTHTHAMRPEDDSSATVETVLIGSEPASPRAGRLWCASKIPPPLTWSFGSSPPPPARPPSPRSQQMRRWWPHDFPHPLHAASSVRCACPSCPAT